MSEKAVRLYADRGLLDARRDPLTRNRLFGADQVERGHHIVSLRRLDFSLERIVHVLTASNPVQAFDDLWSHRRNDTSVLAAEAEDVRATLGQAPTFPTREREQPETLILTSSNAATLTELPEVIGRTTDLLFSVLRKSDIAVISPVYVEFLNRATDLTPGSIRVCVPVAEPLRPAEGTALELAPANRLTYIPFTNGDIQLERLVAAHAHLSTGAFSSRFVPAGPNREIYYPTHGNGDSSAPAMDIAVPIVERPED